MSNSTFYTARSLFDLQTAPKLQKFDFYPGRYFEKLFKNYGRKKELFTSMFESLTCW